MPISEAREASFSAMEAELTDLQRKLGFQEGQFEILERLSAGGSLTEVLHSLVRLIEQQSEGVLGSVLLLDEDGKRLRHGAGPSLPTDYNRAIDGVEIGASAGSCGTAAHEGRRVIVRDIANDPKWAAWCNLAKTHELAACWSEPILSRKREVLGTFAMYYREPRGPGPADLVLIERAAHLAGIAIEQRKTEKALQRSRQDLERRIAERTVDLVRTNQELETEIVERERAEAMARKHEEQLAHVHRVTSVGACVAELAHELNQPLEAIVNYVDVCLRTMEVGVSKQQVLQDLTLISEQARRAGGIIRRLRGFLSRSETDRSPQQMNDIVRDFLPLVTTMAQKHDVVVESRLSESLPTVVADSVHMQQVLMNLVTNAIDAMAEANATDRKVTISTQMRDRWVETAVMDLGPGVDPQSTSRLFDSFYSTRSVGMGLGLSIARTIVEAHGGEIFLDPAVPTGARFVFRLPASEHESSV